MIKFIAGIYTKYLVDTANSPATCTDSLKNPAVVRFCTTKDNCTALAKIVLSNTALDFEALQNYINQGNANISTRILISRALASTSS
jgi:hypothetical protein